MNTRAGRRWTAGVVLCLFSSGVFGATPALIVLPVAVRILATDQGVPVSEHTPAALREIYQRASAIWSQAGIELRVHDIRPLVLSEQAIWEVRNGNFEVLRAALAGQPRPAPIIAVHCDRIGGANGIALVRDDIFLVRDRPSVNDERVPAHEIGHLLGLDHVFGDSGRLLFPATNGTRLDVAEIKAARRAARRIVEEWKTR